MKTDREIMWETGMYIAENYPGVFLTSGEVTYIGSKAGIGYPKRFLSRWLKPFATKHGNNLWKVKTKEEREEELGRLVR